MEPNDKASDRVEAIGAAMGLTASVSALTEELAEVDKRGKHTKRLTHWIVASVIFDVVLTCGIGFVSYNNHYLSNQLRQAQIDSCASSNRVRADDIKLWDRALNAIDPSSKITTHAQAEYKQNFQLFINSTFKSQVCSALPK
jgi:hypothetical protein